MPGTEDRKEGKKGGLLTLLNPFHSRSNYWWLQFVFLGIFLAVGGLLAYRWSRTSAVKLAGHDSAEEERNRGYDSSVDIPPGANMFAEEEENASSPGSEEGAGPSLGGPQSAEFSGQTGLEPQEGNSGGQAASPASAPSPVSPARFQPGQLSGIAGNQQKGDRYSAGRGSFSPLLARNAQADSARVAQELAKGQGGPARRSSVMDSLRNAWKMTVQGARAGSLDSAHNWVARSFDLSPDTGKNLEYSETGKKLDRINPNSLEGYAQKDSLKIDPTKTLLVPGVEAPAESVEDEANDEKYQALKAAGDIMKGMINPLFGGLPFGQGGGVSAQDYAGDAADPSSQATMDGLEVVGPGEMGSGDSFLTNDGTGCLHYCDNITNTCSLSCYG